MTLDRANRCFLAIVAVSLLLGAFVLCGAVGGVLAPLILARISHGGPGVPSAGAATLPALLFLAWVAVGVGSGGRLLIRQLLASLTLARRVRALAGLVPGELARAAAQCGLDGRVVLLDEPGSFSFVYGMLSPRVAVSRGLLERMSRPQLQAVLEHERYHVRNLDPLKVVLVRTLSGALFFLPALDVLCARYVAGRELAADRRAVAVCGRSSLAGALVKVLRGPEWSDLQVAAAIGGAELLDARVAQLETGSEPRPEAHSLTRVLLSLVGATLLAATFLAAVSGLGGPAAVSRATGTGLVSATLLGSLSCTAPFAGMATLAYALIAVCARRTHGFARPWRGGRSGPA